MRTLTLLTDFGTGDYYAAALRGVAATLAPDCRVLDITHDVAPGDLEGASFLLGAAAPWFPEGTVHCVVVDPGVGGARRILAARRGDASFVGPDNGVLTSVLDGSAVHAVEAAAGVFRDGPGTTFDGRDRFVPVAAHLAAGGALDSLGPRIEDPRSLDLPRPTRDGSVLTGRVAHVDRYGNLVTDVPSRWLEGWAGLSLTVDDRSTDCLADRYEVIPAGQAAAIRGSLGTVEVSLRGADLAARWGVERGATVAIRLR